MHECSELYSQHYGIYDEESPKHGNRIRLPPVRIRALLQGDGNWAALARHEGCLVGYAFLLRSLVPGHGAMSWVTQLVVHSDFRNQKIATRLLESVWCFLITSPGGWLRQTHTLFALGNRNAAALRH